MTAWRAKIGIFQKMRIKILKGGQWGPILKKIDSFTLETSKTHLIRNFLRSGRLRVKVNNWNSLQPWRILIVFLDMNFIDNKKKLQKIF